MVHMLDSSSFGQGQGQDPLFSRRLGIKDIASTTRTLVTYEL